MAIQTESRRRLAALMDERRLELRLTWQDVAERGGISLRALANARTGDAEIRPLTQAGIEVALKWERGSVTRILAGGDPLPSTAAMDRETEFRGGVSVSLPTVIVPPRRPPDDDPHGLHRRGDLFPGMSGQMQAEVEPLFREIEARVLRAASDEARRRTEAEGRPVWAQDIIDEVPPGTLVFPGGDARAQTWDRLAARGYSTWQLAQGIAVVMVLDPSRHTGSGDAATGLAGRLRAR
jgi:hypothetical protein